MLKFDVLNRFLGAVQFTAEIDCDESALSRVKLGLAVKWAQKCGADLGGADLGGADLRGADLGGADLRGADLGGAYLRGADLGGADLRGADLGGAYLRGAYLRGADLGGAYLGGAYLRGADLGGADLGGADLGEQWIIQGPVRSDGYSFSLTNFEEEGVRVKAGCRNFTFLDATRHWESTRGDTSLGRETALILAYLREAAKARGYDV